ncbi:MAG TPA: prepilin-type N-terminal cleavage/methylation domain-containing protein [Vicinamibacterales bacterium]|nr:prepilin-type N-terminal cleavage/methylation domain-containing protein [Vicinamibacterales bacterium]
MMKNESGFSLVETLFAIGILSVGALGMAGVFSQGMKGVNTSPDDLIATQKAAEAIESVFSARDSKELGWAVLCNQSQGGIFIDGPTKMYLAGADGILNTNDDLQNGGTIESMVFPGPDQLIGTQDDVTKTLTEFTRQIAITNINNDLRSITVTITYTLNGQTKTYTLTALMSDYA